MVPLPAGTSNDYVARVLAPRLAAKLGQTVIVDNKVGGNGAIGTMEVLRAPPDGQAILVGSNSPLAANVAFVTDLPYDPRRDITPVVGASLTNHVLMAKASFPAASFAGFMELARKRPGRISIGYSTSAVQVQIATINKLAGIKLLPIIATHRPR